MTDIDDMAADVAAVKAAMLAARPAAQTERELKIEGIGVVRIRALTRDEIHYVNDKAGKNTREVEVHTLALAFVSPRFEPAEIRRWLEVAPAGEFIEVMSAVSALSGVDEGAQKSGVSGVRGSGDRS